MKNSSMDMPRTVGSGGTLGAWGTAGHLDRLSPEGVSHAPTLLPEHVPHWFVATATTCREDLGWWETTAWNRLHATHAADPLIVALTGIVMTLRRGGDPQLVAGGIAPFDAAITAQEWLDNDIPPRDVRTWLDAGCWNPHRVRALIQAGVGVCLFYDERGWPLTYRQDGHEPRLLADVVMWGELLPEDAKAYAEEVRQP